MTSGVHDVLVIVLVALLSIIGISIMFGFLLGFFSINSVRLDPEKK